MLVEETSTHSSVESETEQLKEELEKTRLDLMTMQELSAVRKRRGWNQLVEEKTESLSVELREMHARSDREREREHEELNHYHTIGAEREKWEAQEGRLTKELDSLQEELTHCGGVSFGDNTALCEHLEVTQ